MGRKTAIIGGGITGLTAAWHLQQQGNQEVTVIESSTRLGGKINTLREDGFVIEGGPDAYLVTKPYINELVTELGLEQDVITPGSNKFYILRKGRLRTVPAGFGALVPADIWPFITTSLLSPAGKMRLAMERFIPAKQDKGDESLAQFMTRRFGREMLENFAEPLFTGVYASRADELSVKATFPHFHAMEQKYGSITRAVLQQRKHASRSGRSMFRSFRDGMQVLPERLEAKLDRVNIMKGTRVERIRKNNDGYLLDLGGISSLYTDNIVLAIPSDHTAPLLAGILPGASGLFGSIPFVSSVIATLAFPKSAINRSLDATGFLIPSSEQTALSACTWTSEKWKGRAPGGYHLLRCFFSGQDPEKASSTGDDKWIALAISALKDILPVQGDPEHHWVHRWIHAQPQYRTGHLEKIRKMEDALAAHAPNIFLAGSSFRGVGIPDCVRQGRETAEKIIRS